MTTQAHHLISQNLVRDHPLFKALRASDNSFEGATLNLPDKATAAAAASSAMAGDVADAAHEGRHYRAYDRLVSAYLVD